MQYDVIVLPVWMSQITFELCMIQRPELNAATVALNW